MQSPQQPDAAPPRAETVPEPHTGMDALAATVERLRAEVREARVGGEQRALIEFAKGVLVERLRCTAVQAAHQLATLAGRAGLSQLELAADIVSHAAQDRLAETAALVATAADRATDRAADRAADLAAGTDAADGLGEPDGTDRPGGAGASVSVRLRLAESAMLAATDTQAVARSLLEHALASLGATAVAVWALGADAGLTLAGHAGFTAQEARQWRYVPPSVATPAQRALAERRTLWYDAISRTGLPSIGHLHLTGGRATVPATARGRILGVVEICWPQPLPPHPPRIRRRIERQIEALADLCAHTLEDAGPPSPDPTSPDDPELVGLADSLPDPALVLRPELDGEGKLTGFLIRHANRRFADVAGHPRDTVVGRPLLESFPFAAVLFPEMEKVWTTGEPFRTEHVARTTPAGRWPSTTVADLALTRHGHDMLLIWRDKDRTAQLAGLQEHAQRLGRIGGFEEDLLTGAITWNEEMFSLFGMASGDRPIPLEQLRDHAHPDDATAIGGFLRTLLHHRRAAAAAFRLSRLDGVARHMRVVAEPVFGADGRMSAVRGAYQDISSQHWTEVALAVTREQLAHSEQRAAERSRLTLQLQHAIMPPSHGRMDSFGLHVAVRYRPAEKDHLVGGDWYDAVVLPSGRVLLSVGDVAGHGLEAATGMVVLRNALRGLAATGAGPAQLLTWLNLVAHHLTDRVTATAVCGVYDPPSRILRWARAGHPPPLLLRKDDGFELPMPTGALLGAFPDPDYEEAGLPLEPGDTLLLYTDGLIERRDESLPHARQRLLRIAKHPTSSLDHCLDHLLTHCKSESDDDTCLVGVRMHDS